ncbi:MAG: hypothetical protein M0Q19_04815 [Candidatus Cloacimonetes bacterium]|jgi:hypothetical protein|nr:hypothetical protein [Candidatus Cloacimonadota bacterium]MDD4687821.1 hypothetical protein [Candidatus Cloacimonadota bacterium]MDY0299188.1 hypothetical protein [Candidatus Cloacimonadaceae bacterium]
MSASEKFIADRNRIVDALKFSDIPTIRIDGSRLVRIAKIDLLFAKQIYLDRISFL